MRRVVLLPAVVLLAGCGGSNGLSPDAVARVGDRTITKTELAAQVELSRRVYTATQRAFPARGTAAYLALERSAVQLLVDHAVLENQARAAGIEITPAQVAGRVEQIKRRLAGGSELRYREMLRRSGLTEAGIRESARIELLVAGLRGKTPTRPTIVYAPGFTPANDG